MAYTFCSKCGAKVEWADSCSECGAKIALYDVGNAAERSAQPSKQSGEAQPKQSASPWWRRAASRAFPGTIITVLIAGSVLLLFALGGMTIYRLLQPPRFEAPSSFKATGGAMEVLLSWNKRNSGDSVWVTYSEGGYPSSPTDGTPIYEGSGVSHVHTDLQYGTRYYYGIWAVKYVDGERKFSSTRGTYSASPFWRGPVGETLREFVEVAPNTRVVGADGKYIELVNNPVAKDPSWEELRQFLLLDTTDQLAYNDSTFVCADFAEVLHNNAETAGIRAGYVTVDFVGQEIGHALNAFNTTDRGVIYVDNTGDGSGSGCWLDKTVTLQLEQDYIAESVFECEGYSLSWPSMGTVSSFQVFW
jgi:hypothetical protein